jgi:hypothetical protein
MNTFDNNDTDDDGLPIETYESFEAMIVHKLMLLLGLSREQAERWAADRRPMGVEAVLFECWARGFDLSRDDLAAFLESKVDEFIAWADANGRGSPVAEAEDGDEGAIPEADMPVADMLSLLRSGSLHDRIVGGLQLTLTREGRQALLGEHWRGGDVPRWQALLGLIHPAVAGDARAVDRLEAIVTRPEARH